MQLSTSILLNGCGWPVCRQARKRKAASSADGRQPRAAPTGSNLAVRSALPVQLEASLVTATGRPACLSHETVHQHRAAGHNFGCSLLSALVGQITFEAACSLSSLLCRAASAAEKADADTAPADKQRMAPAEQKRDQRVSGSSAACIRCSSHLKCMRVFMGAARPLIHCVPVCARLMCRVIAMASLQGSAGNGALPTQWQAAVQAALAQVLQLPAAQSFAQPVPLDSVPGYREQIARPMDLGSVGRRTQEGHYRSSHQALLDVQLVRWLGSRSGWHLWHCSQTA